MAGLRDHEPFIIEEFNGLWDRGDDESCPSDHLIVANNVQYFESGVETRPPVDQYQYTGSIHVSRVYNYVTRNGQSLLVLNNNGNIFHIVGSTITNILNIVGMQDFGFVAIAGHAYITPFHFLTDANGQTYELGLPNEHVYVYKGDGTPARLAGGDAPSNASPTDVGGIPSFSAWNDEHDGAVTKGLHIIGVTFFDGAAWSIIYSYLFPVVEAPGNQKIQLAHIPTPPGIVQRLVVMTHAIDPKDYNFDHSVFAYYHVAVIPDNTTKFSIIDVTDAALTQQYVGGSLTGIPKLPLLLQNLNQNGYCDIGFHIVAVVYETDTGHLSVPGPEYFASNTYVDVRTQVRIYNIPDSTDPAVIKRHIISTKAIPQYNGDQKGYQFFFIPKATITDGDPHPEYIDVSYYDSDLVADASHLFDNYAHIPAGVALNTYHSRMVLVGDPTYPEKTDGTPDTTQPDNRSVARISAPGEPESISKIDGLIIAPLDGSPLTNCQEFRDILYLFKKTRTYAYVDNSDEPATWQEEVVDQGIGAPVHGIASVLDSGGVNTDFLIIVDWSGLMLFNGTYARPEMSYKIADYWASLKRERFNYIQIANDSIGKRLYITLPPPNENFVLFADYANGMDSKSIRWAKWIFNAEVTSLCLIDTNKLILGMDSA